MLHYNVTMLHYVTLLLLLCYCTCYFVFRVCGVPVLSVSAEVRQPLPQQTREQDLSLGLRLRKLDILHSGLLTLDFQSSALGRDKHSLSLFLYPFLPSCVEIFIFSKVFEDYSEEEQEKYKEELDSIKKRFSHTKLKRKWVSFFNCPAVRRRTKKSVSVCTADNKESHFLDTKQ